MAALIPRKSKGEDSTLSTATDTTTSQNQVIPQLQQQRLRRLNYDRLGVNYRAAVISLIGFTRQTLHIMSFAWDSHKLDPIHPSKQRFIKVISDAFVIAAKRITWASITGSLEVLETLFTIGKVHPAVRGNTAIQSAAFFGQTHIVKALLDTNLIDPSANGNFALNYAASNNHAGVVKLLLESKLLSLTSSDTQYPMIIAAGQGHLEIVKTLLESGKVDSGVWARAALVEAASNDQVEVVRYLLQSGNLPVNWDAECYIESVEGASRNGYLDVVRMLVEPDAEEIGHVGDKSSGKGKGKAVALSSSRDHLPKNVRGVDPNLALSPACEAGQMKVVKYCVSLEAVDPGSNQNNALRMAVLKSPLSPRSRKPGSLSSSLSTSLAQSRSQSPSPSPSQTPLASISTSTSTTASASSFLGPTIPSLTVAPYFLNAPNFDMQSDLSRDYEIPLTHSVHDPVSSQAAVVIAAAMGNMAMVRILLEFRKTSRSLPTHVLESALIAACKVGHAGMVRYFLKLLGFLPHDDGIAGTSIFPHVSTSGASLSAGPTASAIPNIQVVPPPHPVLMTALREAAGLGHTRVVKALLETSLVDPSRGWCEPLRRALLRGHFGVVKVLRDSIRAKAMASEEGRQGLNEEVEGLDLDFAEVDEDDDKVLEEWEEDDRIEGVLIDESNLEFDVNGFLSDTDSDIDSEEHDDEVNGSEEGEL
ncbi:hypothetical protein HDU76_009094 [Blyttiomyces sp. JEL0837]|nr:hypothetical protein HDU76_009094 [Blyttiomyces sp. JEL0837]